MTNIKSIINNHKLQMEAAGLMRRVAPVQLSPQTAALRPSLTKVQEALRERPDRFAVVQPSPMALLFDITLPKIEHILIEVGEERAEQIVNRLCEHGKKMIKEHGLEGSKEHLENLFKDLPDYEAKLKEDRGVEKIIEVYRKLDLENDPVEYLRLRLGNKIEDMRINRGMISLKMKKSTNDQDLICLRKAKNLWELGLTGTQVSDVSPLSGLINLQRLYFGETKVRDVSPLSGLINLQKLYLTFIQVRDVSPLSGLINLRELNLSANSVSDVSPLSGLINLQRLGLEFTLVSDVSPLLSLKNLQELNLGSSWVSDAGIKMLKKAIPGVKIIK